MSQWKIFSLGRGVQLKNFPFHCLSWVPIVPHCSENYNFGSLRYCNSSFFKITVLKFSNKAAIEEYLPFKEFLFQKLSFPFLHQNLGSSTLRKLFKGLISFLKNVFLQNYRVDFCLQRLNPKFPTYVGKNDKNCHLFSVQWDGPKSPRM